MSEGSLPLLAGIVATAIFAGSALPMLHKAARTRDLTSYSLGNLALANLGNALQTVYVLSLPPGPLWLLHAFNAAVAALMLAWFLRYQPDTSSYFDEAHHEKNDHHRTPDGRRSPRRPVRLPGPDLATAGDARPR